MLPPSNRTLFKAAGHLLSYSGWVLGFRLLIYTLVTYFLMSSNSRFPDISEAYGAIELLMVGFGALLFVLLLKWLNPLTSTTSDEIFTRFRFKKKFLPGFLSGGALAIGLTAALLMTGLYKYLGFFIQADEAPLALAGVLLRIVALGCLAYCEEFIFRQKIMNYMRPRLPDLAAAGISALAFAAVKSLQFDLGLSQLLTLLLVGLSVSIKTIGEGDFARGAGFWAGMLIIFHPILSLPVLGNEFQGLLLVRYQTGDESGTARFISGGLGGPLASFSLQLILLLDIGRGIYRNKKILLNPRPRRIK